MPNRIILVGTGTADLRKERVASSILVQIENTNVLFDCGHGVCQRLSEIGIFPNMINDIVISHFHPDHFSDLIPFFHASAWSKSQSRTVNLNIYGPPGIGKLIQNILSLSEPNDLLRDHYQILTHDVLEENLCIDRHQFQFVSLPPHQNHGLKFRCKKLTFAFTGDSAFHQEVIDFLLGTDWAVIDAGHLSADEIIKLAALSNPKVIICSHICESLEIEKIQRIASLRGFTGTIIEGKDLLVLDM